MTGLTGPVSGDRTVTLMHDMIMMPMQQAYFQALAKKCAANHNG